MNQNLIQLCLGLVISSGIGCGHAFACYDAAYYSDRAAWIMNAESEVAAKMHSKEDVLVFNSEEMFLTRKAESARDPVVICGTVASATPKPEETPMRFISNGNPKGTFIDDKKTPFQDRWAVSCKAVEVLSLIRT